MKKATILFITAILIISTFTFVMPVSAASVGDQFVSDNKSWKDTNWGFYSLERGTTDYKACVADGGSMYKSPAVQGQDPASFQLVMAEDKGIRVVPSGKVSLARAFIAPSSGDVEITATIIPWNGSIYMYDGVGFYVNINSKMVYPKNGTMDIIDRENISPFPNGKDQFSYSDVKEVKKFTATIKKGDMIYFIIDPNETSAFDVIDTIYSVKYTKVTDPQTSSASTSSSISTSASTVQSSTISSSETSSALPTSIVSSGTSESKTNNNFILLISIIAIIIIAAIAGYLIYKKNKKSI